MGAVRMCAVPLLALASLWATPGAGIVLPSYFECAHGPGGAARCTGAAPGYLVTVGAGGTARYALPGRTPGVLEVELAGAAQVEPAPEERLPSVTHVYTGGAHTAMTHWSRVRFAGVYPGTDMIYTAGRPGIEIQFVLEPGADPALIRLRFQSARKLEIAESGDLLVHSATGTLRYRRPSAFQGGETVGIKYALRRDEVGFSIGDYDRARPLVIDPVVTFSSFVGGGGFDAIHGVATDSNGFVYIAGETSSAAFNTGSAVLPGRDAFVCKIAPDGSELRFCTVLSGTGNDAARAIAVDSAGTAVIVGLATAGFPVAGAAISSQHSGNEDAFVARIDASGALTYSSFLGAGGSDIATGVALDENGGAWVTGYTSSLLFPTTATAPQRTHAGGSYDAFLARIGASGNLAFSSLYGKAGSDVANGVAYSPTQGVCIAGSTTSTDLVTNLLPGKGGASADGFLACLDAAALTWRYRTYLGGTSVDEIYAVRFDGAGRVVVAGSTASADFPVTAGAVQAVKKADRDAFVSVLDFAAGVTYSTFLGGNGSDTALAIAPADAGRIWAGGFTSSTDFPLKSAVQTAGGGFDGFLALLDTTSSALSWSSYFGGAGDDRIRGIAAVAAGVVAAGYTSSAEFRVTSGVLGPVAPGPYDGFVVKLGSAAHAAIVWQNDARQAKVQYFAPVQGSPSESVVTLFASPVPGWRIVGFADFDGNGWPDVLWQNDDTRQVIIDFFGGDGGTTMLGWSYLYSQATPGWRIVAVADFNADGRPDVVWQSDTTRQVTVNYFGGAKGTTQIGWAWLNAEGVPGWTLAGAADFDRDGIADLVWQEDATRIATVHYLGGPTGTTVTGWAWLYGNPTPGWRIAGCADFNGDGAPDVVWQSDTTGQATVNYFTGARGVTYSGWAWLEPNPVAWRVAATR